MTVEDVIESDLPTISGEWSFILNCIEITCDLPFEISTGIRINKASFDQVVKIKERLISLLGGDYHKGIESLYEKGFIKSPEFPNQFLPTELPQEKWRYYIVEIDDDTGKKKIYLQFASNTSLLPMDIISLSFKNNDVSGWRTGSAHNFFFGKIAGPAKRAGLDELLDLSEAYNLYVNTTGGVCTQSEYPELVRAQELLDNLSLIPEFSGFHILGLFSIIEMLITHNPKLEDRGDTITHQMQSKIPLLSKRFKHKIDSESFFGEVSDKKIWAALYKYRSAIAHGGTADFKGDLQVLKSETKAKEFLLDVVRKMIRHALSEPILYQDLRLC